MRKHSVGDELCAGSGRPAVGELPEVHIAPRPAESVPQPASRQRDEPRIASVA